MAKVMGEDWIDLKIDAERHLKATEVIARLTGGESKGYPWIVVLDGAGEALVTSDAPAGGNIGCPVTEAECAWFMEMLSKTRQRVDDAGLATIRRELEEHAKALRR